MPSSRAHVRLRLSLSRASALTALLTLFTARAPAGELSIGWNRSTDSHAAGYRVYVGSQPGVYARVMDAGAETMLALKDLPDEHTSYVIVKAYDRKGRESGAVSDELASLPRPRIESIDPPSIRPGATELIAIGGTNIDPSALVRSRDARLTVRAATPDGPGRLILEVEAADGSGAEMRPEDAVGPGGEIRPGGEILMAAGSFIVINPGRKADQYFRNHPEALDADGNRRIDEQDVRIVRDAFGSSRGGPSYSFAADIDGDGTVDGHDLARILAGTSAIRESIPRAR